MTDWDVISHHISTVTGRDFRARTHRQQGGGCINATSILSDGSLDYFVKRNDLTSLDLFEAEADGLAALDECGAIRVPKVICSGQTETTSYLVLERLDLKGGPSNGAQTGRRLAALHRCHGATFGWRRDNYIGATPQPNTQSEDWATFWRDHRLGFQLELALKNGHGRRLQPGGDRLLSSLHGILDHDPSPSLLHGDLWSGNLGYLSDGTPSVFDPAVYFGDREADLAMTELFGGFGGDFYAAYMESWPLAPGYETRKTLYNLYHILNHLNLFGPGYLGQASGMIERLLAQLR